MPGILGSLLSWTVRADKVSTVVPDVANKDIQGRPRNTEVKQHSKGHTAGQCRDQDVKNTMIFWHSSQGLSLCYLSAETHKKPKNYKSDALCKTTAQLKQMYPKPNLRGHLWHYLDSCKNPIKLTNCVFLKYCILLGFLMILSS